MQFHTLGFATFFAAVYGIYLLIPHKWQNRLLLAASYVFYASWDWRFSFLLLFVTLVNFSVKNLKACVALNLLTIGLFKYLGVFTHGWASLGLIFPVGLSFYTFQMMSYPIEVSRGTIEREKNFLDFALFGSFFPTVVMGPVERAKDLLPQIKRPRRITRALVHEGAWLIFLGIYKKILVADNLARVTRPVFAHPGAHTGFEVLIAGFLFTLQMYADFSGYSDMARGIARLMGFEISRNFRAPFFSSNLSELWQRWHTSLTTWIRDYVFYPLALAKPFGKQLAPAAVILLTWLLFGIWHGPSLKYAAWGLYHGTLLVLYNKLRAKLPSSRILGRLTVFVSAAGLIFFAADTLKDSLRAFRALFFRFGAPALDVSHFLTLIWLALPLIVIDYFIYRTDDEWVVFRLPWWLRGGLYYAAFYLIVFYGVFSAQQYFYYRY